MFMEKKQTEAFYFYVYLTILFQNVQRTFKSQVKSSQVTFIYIALFTIQIVSKQLHSDNM